MSKNKKTTDLNVSENLQENLHKSSEPIKSVKENKPSQKEIDDVEKEYKLEAEKFNNAKYEIGDSSQTKDIANFLIEFLEKYVYWTKNGWMGVLKLHEEITEFLKTVKDGEPFTLSYQALEFTFFALSNPGGSGIKSAREIEKVADLYAKVIEYTGKKVEIAREKLKHVQWLQEKWAAMSQGFYIEEKDGPKDNKNTSKETFEPPTPEELMSNSDESSNE